MKALYTVLLLVCSNTFMTIAWYGHLKFNGSNNGSPLPLFLVILASWGVAFFEYCFQVPANRLGFRRERRPLLAHPAQNHTGGHLLARVYGFHHSGFPYRDFPLEPYRRFRVHRSGRLFRIQKIVRDSAVQRAGPMRTARRKLPAGRFAIRGNAPLEQRPVVLFQNIHRIEHLLRYPGPLEGIEIGIGVRVGSHEGV